jgi:hypothetical protein
MTYTEKVAVCSEIRKKTLKTKLGYWMLTLSNPIFSATRILPSSYLFLAGKRLVGYL